MKTQVWFLAIIASVLITLAGLAWDALIHAQDHAHLVAEALFDPSNPFANPGHVVFGLGLGLTSLFALLGFTSAWLEGNRWGHWQRALLVPAFLWLIVGLAGTVTLAVLAQIG